MASLVSFLVGTAVLGAIVLIRFGSLALPWETLSAQPGWIWIGGCLGVIMLTMNILLLPRLGAIQTVIFPVAGMVASSMVIDHFGLFNGARIAFGLSRFAGCACVLVGAILAAMGKEKNAGETQGTGSTNLMIWRLLGFLSGILGPMQAAVNGALGRILEAPLKASFISFAVGTLTLLLIVFATKKQIAVRRPAKGEGPWWMWFGGLIGANTVFSSALLAPSLGTGLLMVLNQFGMMAGGFAIDGLGLFETPKKRLTANKVQAAVLVLLGVIMIHGF